MSNDTSDRAKQIHHLTNDDREKLTMVNRLLTELTVTHDIWCECSLCEGRMSTDVQDEDAFHVRYTPIRDD
jgi:hypothetical protein